MSVAENILQIGRSITAAMTRAGRTDSVVLVAVTKTFGPEMVDEVIAGGITDIGENRVQEFLGKADSVRGRCRWHLIGPLQRNKAGKIIGRFHLVHSLDRMAIAETLDRLGSESDVTTAALIQVNTSGETAKHGFEPAETARALERILTLRHIDIRGLMTIGPLGGDLDGARRCFRDLYDLRERLRRVTGAELPELSMGMSGDYEAAIEEGATIIRVGSAITGARG